MSGSRAASSGIDGDPAVALLERRFQGLDNAAAPCGRQHHPVLDNLQGAVVPGMDADIALAGQKGADLLFTEIFRDRQPEK